MVQVEPARRPTASNALLHPYFRQVARCPSTPPCLSACVAVSPSLSDPVWSLVLCCAAWLLQCYVDRLVTCGELVEQNKKLEAVRALLYRARVELNWDEAVKLEVRPTMAHLPATPWPRTTCVPLPRSACEQTV